MTAHEEDKELPQVLLVEDLEDTVVGLTLDLEYRGSAVFHSTSYSSARDMLLASRFGAILVDLNIPYRSGDDPSPDYGRRLVSDLCEGTLPLNGSTPVMIITAQKIDVRPHEFAGCQHFAGVGSKIGDSRWLLRKLASLGIGSIDTELDSDILEPQRERIQLVFHGWQGPDAVVEAQDLNLPQFHLPRRAFTDGVRRALERRATPVVLWAIGNVLAQTPDDLRPREFVIADEQLDPGRDYRSPSWLGE